MISSLPSRPRILAGILLLLIVFTSCGTHHAVGFGAGVVALHAGGETDRAFSPLVGARLWQPDGVGGLLTADLQPLPVRSPAGDESVSSLFVLPTLQLMGGRVTLRGGVGPSLHVWSGPDAVDTFAWGAAAGSSLGLALSGSARGWSVEAFGRVAGGLEVTGSVVGVQAFRTLR